MMEHRTTWTCSWMKPVCLYITLYNSSEGHFSPSTLSKVCYGLFRSAFFITFCIHVLILLNLWTSHFLFVPLLSSLAAFILALLLLFSLHFASCTALLSLSTVYAALTGKMSSFHTYILLSALTLLLPLSIHHSLSLTSLPPSRLPSRDNYYKSCEDQLVFKQLNKQGLGLLTVAIQQQSSETVAKEIILCVLHYSGHLKNCPGLSDAFLLRSQ